MLAKSKHGAIHIYFWFLTSLEESHDTMAHEPPHLSHTFPIKHYGLVLMGQTLHFKNDDVLNILAQQLHQKSPKMILYYQFDFRGRYSEY